MNAPAAFSVAVVAHPSRGARAESLADRAGAEAVLWDDSGYGCSANHLRALGWLEGSEGWAVVLEDDAVPAPGFRDQLAAALLNCPPVPVCSLYLGTGRPPHWQPSIARAEGAVQVGASPDVPWFTAGALLHGVGYAVRRERLAELRAGARRRIAHGWPIDEAISGWLVGAGELCAYSRPSLVDHDDGPTLIPQHPTKHKGDTPHRPERRRAWRFGTRAEWAGGVLPLPEPLRRHGGG